MKPKNILGMRRARQGRSRRSSKHDISDSDSESTRGDQGRGWSTQSVYSARQNGSTASLLSLKGKDLLSMLEGELKVRGAASLMFLRHSNDFSETEEPRPVTSYRFSFGMEQDGTVEILPETPPNDSDLGAEDDSRIEIDPPTPPCGHDFDGTAAGAGITFEQWRQSALMPPAPRIVPGTCASSIYSQDIQGSEDVNDCDSSVYSQESCATATTTIMRTRSLLSLARKYTTPDNGSIYSRDFGDSPTLPVEDAAPRNNTSSIYNRDESADPVEDWPQICSSYSHDTCSTYSRDESADPVKQCPRTSSIYSRDTYSIYNRDESADPVKQCPRTSSIYSRDTCSIFSRKESADPVQQWPQMTSIYSRDERADPVQQRPAAGTITRTHSLPNPKRNSWKPLPPLPPREATQESPESPPSRSGTLKEDASENQSPDSPGQPDRMTWSAIIRSEVTQRGRSQEPTLRLHSSSRSAIMPSEVSQRSKSQENLLRRTLTSQSATLPSSASQRSKSQENLLQRALTSQSAIMPSSASQISKSQDNLLRRALTSQSAIMPSSASQRSKSQENLRRRHLSSRSWLSIETTLNVKASNNGNGENAEATIMCGQPYLQKLSRQASGRHEPATEMQLPAYPASLPPRYSRVGTRSRSSTMTLSTIESLPKAAPPRPPREDEVLPDAAPPRPPKNNRRLWRQDPLQLPPLQRPEMELLDEQRVCYYLRCGHLEDQAWFENGPELPGWCPQCSKARRGKRRVVKRELKSLLTIAE